MTYGLLSDIHAHAWSAFSTRLPCGRNSRLQIIVDELKRAAADTRDVGGDLLVFGGDLFHTRGSLDPEVFNPVTEGIKELLADGFRIVAIPGNHDLKSNETTELGNAFQSLKGTQGFGIITQPKLLDSLPLAMVPWIPKLDDLKAVLEALADEAVRRGSLGQTDLVMHAGIDGVLSGMPAHGLTPDFLAKLGFRRVFAGHYHHHCSFEDGKVWSIGATTHQTASDIGTKAGFLLVDDAGVAYRASRAPEFVEVSDETDPDEIPNVVDGNYVRVRGLKLSEADEVNLREELIRLGAKGVVMNVERQTASARASTSSVKAKSLEASVADYIERQASPHMDAVKTRAAAIISAVRAATE
ncbi:DNA repair exonuclease SbcCD nuclease subunit [Methylobacterium sp. PvP062]|uniref:DNA repair exonuclease SbcCD nuclease subunit n=1 Tax=Methylobacterium radiotolerans TaxID=31998 RepID=A0ABV2NUP9_9HYPH|nr:MULTISPECIES: metallophosphoesterase [unclassified Methylobacterium]MBP2498396.1 DNA repair exonuclease SbcCD nuclease subunit [Methylobacterium sp. PvP105]MBP2505780.1 DNA repair exonuclease SbcCD nuclease subunit [Methylobacterium sp. PvP109]